MDTQERRQASARTLEEASGPVSAASLAKSYSVSRQVIVGDIALLRAGGMDISATPRGYLLPRSSTNIIRTLACRHDIAQTEAELNAIVDQGCTVLDVIVEHPVYGQLTAQLHLSSRYEVSQFVSRCHQADAPPLSTLTGGIHLHTISCPGEDAYLRVQTSLRNMGILVDE